VDAGSQQQSGFVHGLDPIPVPFDPGGGFRKMVDMDLELSTGSSLLSFARLRNLHHGDSS